MILHTGGVAFVKFQPNPIRLDRPNPLLLLGKLHRHFRHLRRLGEFRVLIRSFTRGPVSRDGGAL